MKNFKFLFQLFAFSLLLVILPTLASAQYRGNRDDDDYNNGRYSNNGRNNNNYNDRNLQDAISRVERSSDRFTREFDRALDNSRINGTRREDRVNNIAKDFEDAADRLKNSYNDGRNYNNSANDAQNLIQLGYQLDRFVNNRNVGNNRGDNRLASEWSNIQRDLNIIANAYGNNNRGYNNGRGNGRYNNRRNNDDYNNNNRRNNRYPY